MESRKEPLGSSSQTAIFFLVDLTVFLGRFKTTLQIKLGGALGKTPLNPIHIWVKHVLPKIFWA